MGVEEKIVVFRLLSQFLSKALFFIDSRARVAKLNKFVNSVAKKVLIKQEKPEKLWGSNRCVLCTRRG